MRSGVAVTSRRGGAILVLALGLGVGLLVEPVFALHVKQRLQERMREADYIVVGMVANQHSHRYEQRALIYTDFVINVTEALKHPSQEPLPTQLVVRTPGGRVGRLFVHVSDIPTFQVGQRVVLFLRKGRALGICHLVAGTAGMCRLMTDPETQQEVLVDESGSFLDDLEREQVDHPPAPQQTVSLSQFRRYLTEHLGETSR